jgi:hypothetical protein
MITFFKCPWVDEFYTQAFYLDVGTKFGGLILQMRYVISVVYLD